MSNNLISNAIYMDDVPMSQWREYGIGKGYRSICYTTDAEKRGRIILFGFDTNGNRKTFIFPWKSQIKYNVKYKTDEKDMNDCYVATKTFDSKYLRDKYVLSATGLSIVECLKPEQEFAHFMWDEDVLKDDFNKQPLRIQYFDIETEISDTFMKPVDALNRINMMTIYDTFTDKFYTWALQKAEVNFTEEPICSYPKDKFIIFDFNNDEDKMLEHFLNWYEDNYPDVNATWNGRAYDIPYLVRRIENTLGKNEARRLSPISRYFIKQVNHDNSRADVSAEIEVNIDGLFTADCLVLYRDKFGIAPALDGGYNLSNVGIHEDLGHKVEYSGTLKDLYVKDWQKFYEYNVMDVDLLMRIDKKCKMIQLARQISSFGLTNYGAIYSSISYLIGSVISFAKTQMGGKIFKSYLAEKKQFNSFEGAFVFPTTQGVFRGGIGCIDFASLYPSCIRATNVSSETFVGKVLIYRKTPEGNIICDAEHEPRFDLFDDNIAKAPDIVKYELKTANGQRKPCKLEQLRELINTKCIYTPNNTLFLKHTVRWGVIAKWCETFYGLRKKNKKIEMQAFHKLHDKTITLTPEEKLKLQLQEENYHCVQLGFKAMINSIYGMLGTAFSPIANPDIAQTVTRLGRFCNQSTAEFIRGQFIKYFKIPENYVHVIGGDTDSFFLEETLHIRR